MVEGYQIDFSSVPPACVQCDITRLEALDQEILDHLNKGAIEKVKSGKFGFCQANVCSPQGGSQVETNYQSKIPQLIRGKPHFKMEDNKSLKDIL